MLRHWEDKCLKMRHHTFYAKGLAENHWEISWRETPEGVLCNSSFVWFCGVVLFVLPSAAWYTSVSRNHNKSSWIEQGRTSFKCLSIWLWSYLSTVLIWRVQCVLSHKPHIPWTGIDGEATKLSIKLFRVGKWGPGLQRIGKACLTRQLWQVKFNVDYLK